MLIDRSQIVEWMERIKVRICGEIKMGRTYQPLPQYNNKEINRILQTGTIEEVIILPLSVGQYHMNWKIAQDICAELSEHDDERVRANSALGLAYIARTKGRLEKHIVKPVLLKLLNNCNGHRWRVIDSIEDINIFMKWKTGEKRLTE